MTSISNLIPIKLHFSFYIVTLLLYFSGFFKFYLVIILILTVHELGHYSMARFFGWSVEKIIITPFGGVCIFNESYNLDNFKEFIVTIMGPVFQGVLIILGIVLHKRIGFNNQLFYFFMRYNYIILMFNLIPIWPLDGGKLLYIVCNIFLPFKISHKSIIHISSIILVFLIGLFLYLELFNLNYILIAIFLGQSIILESKNHSSIFNRVLYDKMNHRSKKIKLVTTDEKKLKKLVRILYKGRATDFLIGRKIFMESKVIKNYFNSFKN